LIAERGAQGHRKNTASLPIFLFQINDLTALFQPRRMAAAKPSHSPPEKAVSGARFEKWRDLRFCTGPAASRFSAFQQRYAGSSRDINLSDF
jgi:hypothetical protein